jgi:recombination protein RecT
MADQDTAVATRSSHPLVQFREELESRANELKMALPAHISEQKFQRTVITAVQQNPGLLKASRQSLVLACMKAANDGLLPDGREAALVPFKVSRKVDGNWQNFEEVAYIPMVYGVRKKILQARDAKGEPVVSALEVGVVYKKEVEAGHFYYEVGKYPPLGHRPMLELTTDDTADENIVGAYSIATMSDGTKSYEFMRRFELDKVQNASQTGSRVDRQGKPKAPKGPWLDWYPEMAKKTVLRRHAKSLPQSGDLIFESDDDERSAESAALVLGSTAEDEPTLITDDSGNTIDADTGEVVAEASQPEETASEGAHEDDSATAEQSDDDDQTPSEKAAASAIKLFDTAENIVDLQTRYKEVEPHLSFMGEELADSVERSFDENRTRLGGDKVPAKAKAKAAAEAEPVK